MPDEALDLEADWGSVRAPPPTVVANGRKGDIKSSLAVAAAKAQAQLAAQFGELSGQPLTSDDLARMTAEGTRLFIQHWHEAMRQTDMAGLVEVILDGQSLTVDELKGFVRALPMSLVQRIVESGMSLATGVHALMAVEFQFRRGHMPRDYALSRDLAQNLVIAFTDKESGREVKFKLTEKFEVGTTPEPGVPSG